MNARSSGSRADPRTPPGRARAAVSRMRRSSSDRAPSMSALPPGAITRCRGASVQGFGRLHEPEEAVLEPPDRATYTVATRETGGGLGESETDERARLRPGVQRKRRAAPRRRGQAPSENVGL